MKFSEQVKATLWNLIDQMSLHVADFTVHPDQDFTRKKKWDFPSLLKFIISMESQSLKNELLKYFDYATNCPSTASFNQRRAQVRAEAFQFLFNAFTAKYDVNPKLFKGYRLIACDRSGVNIAYNPNDKESYMSNGSAKGYNQLHLNALYDLQDKVYLDIIIQPGKSENERGAFREMVRRYTGSPKTIFIADRGYESYNDMAHVMEKGAFFLFRCKDIDSNGILSGLKHKLPETEKFDCEISIILTRKRTDEIENHPEIYKGIYRTDTFDYMDIKTRPYYGMKFRALRFSVSENSYECIITNLPSTEFSTEEIKKLYTMRWGIETSFRELKYAVGLTSFHAKKREYIIQEIWARLILYNFCEIITAHVAVNKCTKKHVYQINYTFAIQVCRYFISKRAEKSPPDVEALISKEILPVRPERHNPRKIEHKKAVSFLYRVA